MLLFNIFLEVIVILALLDQFLFTVFQLSVQSCSIILVFFLKRVHLLLFLLQIVSELFDDLFLLKQDLFYLLLVLSCAVLYPFQLKCQHLNFLLEGLVFLDFERQLFNLFFFLLDILSQKFIILAGSISIICQLLDGELAFAVVVLLIVELHLHLCYFLAMRSNLILQLNDLILVYLHIISLLCLYLINHLEEFFLFSLEVVNLEPEVV